MNTQSEKTKIIAVVGPTATGKSDLAVLLGTRFNGEVISADSRQVYKGLNIGTGKITEKEMKGVPHHMLDVADPREVFSVHDFVQEAKALLPEITANNHIPIICGGTGFYIDTLLEEHSLPPVPPNEELRSVLEQKSTEELFEDLSLKDPQRARTIDRHNKVRLIRALEIIDSLGRVPISQSKDLYDVVWIGLTTDTHTLEKRIRDRLHLRLQLGLEKEVKFLHQNGLSWERMEELGLEYRYISRILRVITERSEGIKELEQEILKYAKRQMTWFKRNKKIQWFNCEDEETPKKILSVAEDFLTSQEKKQ